MPRKLIPPSEPLPPDLQERLEVFKKYTVEHALLNRKDDELTQRIWEPGGFAFLLLSGPTGVGKSELLRVVTHRMQTRVQVVPLGGRLPLPVILVETPAPFTYREWYERVLRALDEPFIEEVIYREVGTSPNGKKAKGDARLTLERVREQKLVEASLADMAVDIVSGEQQVALTEGDRSQLNRLLQMESEAVPPETSAVEAKPERRRRTNTRPGTRKVKRDHVEDPAETISEHT